ncbi:MAG: PEGA domain-containing protein [Candidatus Pacebacteria bacterium]|nr:PEGA domain-containing protein [Candidatus Paceibacterota bacterium]
MCTVKSKTSLFARIKSKVKSLFRPLGRQQKQGQQEQKQQNRWKNKINPRVLYSLLSLLLIAGGSYLAIQYAQGNYRLTKNGFLPQSGLLSANSFPTGAQVLINDRLITATDDTVYLEPGEYQVKIVKDGYSPWEKNLTIKEELVTQTNAQLFPVAPSIAPLTFTGAQNLLPSPDGRKIVYYTASASASAKNGLYLLELSDNLNPFQKSSKQISDDEQGLDLATADMIWSPDSTQLMILGGNKQLLIDTDQKTNLSTQPDISFKRKQLLSAWEEEMYLRERQYLAEFPQEVIQVATQSAKNVYISPDKKRLLYTATASAFLPEDLVPPIPSTSTQPEDRQLEPGKIYVYDREEDKNFEVAVVVGAESASPKQLLALDMFNQSPMTLEASPSAFNRLQATSSAQTAFKFNSYHTSLHINTLQWFADSKHLMFVKDNEIKIMEYDGANVTTLYSGPFANNFIYPWPDGSRLVILTSFSPDSPQNLYSIELK